MASAHVAAAPHGGRRKVKGALGIRFSKSREGIKETPHFLSQKVRGLSGLFFKNFSEFQQKTFFSVIDGLLRDTGERRPLSFRESLSEQRVYQLAVTVR